MSNITAFEKQVLDACLVGDDPKLEILRAQAIEAIVTDRSHSNWGAYIDFSIPDSIQRLESTPIIIHDVKLEVSGVTDGVATLLYVLEGKLQFLELATYSDGWPDDPEITSIGYLQEKQVSPTSFALIPIDKRDKETIDRALMGRQSPDAV